MTQIFFTFAILTILKDRKDITKGLITYIVFRCDDLGRHLKSKTIYISKFQ